MCVSHNPCLFHRKMDVVSCLTEKNGLMKFSRLPCWDTRKRGEKDKLGKKATNKKIAGKPSKSSGKLNDKSVHCRKWQQERKTWTKGKGKIRGRQAFSATCTKRKGEGMWEVEKERLKNEFRKGETSLRKKSCYKRQLEWKRGKRWCVSLVQLFIKQVCC